MLLEHHKLLYRVNLAISDTQGLTVLLMVAYPFMSLLNGTPLWVILILLSVLKYIFGVRVSNVRIFLSCDS